MARFLAGAAACLLLVTGAFLLWQGQAQQTQLLPDAPPARPGAPSMVVAGSVPQAPEATPKSREQKRFSRADKDGSGWLTATEYASTAPPPPKRPRCSC